LLQVAHPLGGLAQHLIGCGIVHPDEAVHHRAIGRVADLPLAFVRGDGDGAVVADAGETVLQRGEQLVRQHSGPAEQTQRLGIVGALETAEFAAAVRPCAAQAFEAQHQFAVFRR